MFSTIIGILLLTMFTVFIVIQSKGLIQAIRKRKKLKQEKQEKQKKGEETK